MKIMKKSSSGYRKRSQSALLDAMTMLSRGALFRIFCCPPFPSKIAAKIAFLPPEPSYCFRKNNTKLQMLLNEKADWIYTEREKEAFEVFSATTSRGNKIACLLVKCTSTPRYTILFSHGNAVDIGQMSSFFLGLGYTIECNVFSYDYSGYGISTGKPSEKNLYSDISSAWHTLINNCGLHPSEVILYGQSIGTVPTVDLASRHQVGAVILHSPLSSGLRVAFPSTRKTWCCDVFTTIEKINKVISPVLVIHGKADEIIDVSHGKALFEKCRLAVDPLWLENAGHNDIEIYHEYIERLQQFIFFELPNLAMPNSRHSST